MAIQDPSTFPLTDSGIVVGNAACQPFCGTAQPYATECELITVDATPMVRCFAPCTGRRPAGLARLAVAEDSALARHFGEMAFLEAASVDAFRILRDELRHHRAPRRLIRAAERSARDELRHARVGRALARRHGARAFALERPARIERSLEAIAIENAVEGCVRETFGVAVGIHQARCAKDPAVRALLARIARDEARHAALAQDVARWLDARLDPGERARVRAARDRAIEELAQSLRTEPDPEVASAAGLPSAAVARRMVEQLRAELWSS